MNSGAELEVAEASFVDENTLKLSYADGDSKLVKGERFFINTGSTTVIPPILGIEGNEHVYTSETLMSEERLPKRLVVIGAVDAKFIGALHVTGDMDNQCLVSSQMGPYMEDLLQGLDRECLKLLKSVKVSQVNDDLVRLSKTDEKGRKDRQSQPSGRKSSDG